MTPTTLSILSLLAGVALGQRWRVAILVPAVILVSLAATGAGIAQDHGLWSIALTAIVADTAVQIGYLVGLLIRPIPVSAPANRTTTSVQRAALAERGCSDRSVGEYSSH